MFKIGPKIFSLQWHFKHEKKIGLKISTMLNRFKKLQFYSIFPSECSQFNMKRSPVLKGVLVQIFSFVFAHTARLDFGRRTVISYLQMYVKHFLLFETSNVAVTHVFRARVGFFGRRFGPC